MSAHRDLQRLLTWLSPAFPVGAFAYSAGLETAIVSGALPDGPAVEHWIAGSLTGGSLKTDAVLLASAYNSAPDELAALVELATALTPAAERLAEMLQTGDAFRIAAAAWPSEVLGKLPERCPYPIVVGAVAAGHGIGLEPVLLSYLTAAVQSQVSVAVRLVPIGQTEGLRIVAGLEEAVAGRAAWAAGATLADLGGIGYAADIATMAHETLGVRIFRS